MHLFPDDSEDHELIHGIHWDAHGRAGGQGPANRHTPVGVHVDVRRSLIRQLRVRYGAHYKYHLQQGTVINMCTL